MGDIVDDDRDLVLEPNTHTWITVGTMSVRVAHRGNGAVDLQVYPLGQEDGDVLGNLIIDP
jgi:hypothetical protein